MLPRWWLILALTPVFMTGCFTSQGTQSRWLKPFLFRSHPDTDTAFIEYVLIERKAGGDDINRHVWDRIDEQVLPTESRALLEKHGLRIGVQSGTTTGELRRMIDEPRTDRGHRFRSFPLEKPIPLYLSDSDRVQFQSPIEGESGSKFTKNDSKLGFRITAREGQDGKMILKLVPEVGYRETTTFGLDPDRENKSIAFPALAFEITLSSDEFLVIGSDSYWTDTFGHSMFMTKDQAKPYQRLCVLRAGLNKAEKSDSTLGSKDNPESPPPLATQAGVIRASRP